ncbi:DNA ligase, putative (plasmid) [Sinorhizobium fredii NGR234]|uniref:DNA ligase (ATP) n=1 Tax=Sinorhizobium fredii (strain NBRC 101917 / NGR234) TaxID=394 RepID=C3KR46_SINFN|nr:ATP-dependent DNA ligase [Sinorhizobium fredii]ACP22554.1 DNA ligase, putative [Sinorhizobium fredii NGR234]
MPSPAHRKPIKDAGSSRLTGKPKVANDAESGGGFALPVSTAPMEARSAAELPSDGAWQYEPKWDGFRCLAFKSGEEVDLRAKSGKPLGRFFPEVLSLLRNLDAVQFVVDGELVIEVEGRLSFDALQMRLHPAASRVQKLSQQTPARLVLFDILVDAKGAVLTDKPLAVRRAALEAFASENAIQDKLELSPFTLDRKEAEQWLASWEAGATDGVVAKRRDGRYECGERAMVKVKRLKTADCVVGGFRYESDSDKVGSLLLGLYDMDGTLDHVGFTATISDKERPALTRRLEALREPPGFTGKAPGGPSRWSTERSGEWQPVRPELVVEVRFDHVSSRRFRHGTKLMRWRPDKDPRQCTYEQIEPR